MCFHSKVFRFVAAFSHDNTREVLRSLLQFLVHRGVVGSHLHGTCFRIVA